MRHHRTNKKRGERTKKSPTLFDFHLAECPFRNLSLDSKRITIQIHRRVIQPIVVTHLFDDNLDIHVADRFRLQFLAMSSTLILSHARVEDMCSIRDEQRHLFLASLKTNCDHRYEVAMAVSSVISAFNMNRDGKNNSFFFHLPLSDQKETHTTHLMLYAIMRFEGSLCLERPRGLVLLKLSLVLE